MTSPTATLLSRAAALFRPPVTWVMPEPDAGLAQQEGLRVMHCFRPDVRALARMKIDAAPRWPENVGNSVAISLPRQSDWALGLVAGALDRLEPGGLLLAAAPNDAGGKRYAKLLAAHFDLLLADSKNHCRLVALERPAQLPAVADDWRRAYAPQLVEGTSLKTLPGTFSCDHVDPGSALLAAKLPPLKGRVADFGAGWGYLSHRLLHGGTPPAQIDLYEADMNALEMAKANLAQDAARAGFYWHDLLSEPCPHAYDAIVMNPPFHALRTQGADIGQGFIRAAAQALKQEGALWMVANRHLPYEKVLAETFAEQTAIADEQGFKVLVARGPRLSR